ncbi:hypothetical protein BDFB_011877 [Asbolus verrucosus]|uniref:Uncharacterized protein n=1 Tax=Asbolus verrucosus TaxID=1661398 RepID=A0A482VYQ8_ASBVE|nr:hypothetical protein BDFB_011877 [Asbolus verrucosus]
MSWPGTRALTPGKKTSPARFATRNS